MAKNFKNSGEFIEATKAKAVSKVQWIGKENLTRGILSKEELFIWDCVLNDEEINKITDGADPTTIRPDKLRKGGGDGN